MGYETIAADVRERIITETRAKLSARRAFLEKMVADADNAMRDLDRQRLDHFLAKITAEAELRDMAAHQF